MDEYYDTTKKKFWDFVIGFVGFWIVNFPLAMLLIQSLSDAISVAFILLCLNGFIAYLAFKKGRKYITNGIIAGLIIPLLIVGTCTLILFG